MCPVRCWVGAEGYGIQARRADEGMSDMIQCFDKVSRPRSGAFNCRDHPGSEAGAAALPSGGSRGWLRCDVSSAARRGKLLKAGSASTVRVTMGQSFSLFVRPLSSWGYNGLGGQALKCDSDVTVPVVPRKVQQMGQGGPCRAVQPSTDREEGS